MCLESIYILTYYRTREIDLMFATMDKMDYFCMIMLDVIHLELLWFQTAAALNQPSSHDPEHGLTNTSPRKGCGGSFLCLGWGRQIIWTQGRECDSLVSQEVLFSCDSCHGNTKHSAWTQRMRWEEMRSSAGPAIMPSRVAQSYAFIY